MKLFTTISLFTVGGVLLLIVACSCLFRRTPDSRRRLREDGL